MKEFTHCEVCGILTDFPCCDTHQRGICMNCFNQWNPGTPMEFGGCKMPWNTTPWITEIEIIVGLREMELELR